MKVCSKCEINEARQNQAWCNPCHTEYERRRRTYESERNQNLKKKFGITSDQYDEMHSRQSGVCLICSQPETSMRKDRLRKLSVDHDHATGKIRGLLCSECNIGIGKFKDSPDLLRKAASYLE
jgi:hypothetical protein